MKTTVDIPEELLSMAMKFSQAKSKKDAVITALEEYTRHKKVEQLSAAIKEEPAEFKTNEEIEAADLAEAARQLRAFQDLES